MADRGRRYLESRGRIDRESTYTPAQAVRMLKDFPGAKFDETVEVHFRLGLNVRHADEQLRGTLMLPHGTGKEARVAVFAEGDKAREAEEAGADVIGSADLAKRVEEGFTDFDVAIATPDQMGNVGRLGRVLGPRGLMPNPKTGTATCAGAKAATRYLACGSRSSPASSSRSRSIMSRVGRERPVSMKLRCRADTSAASATSSWDRRRRSRQVRTSEPIGSVAVAVMVAACPAGEGRAMTWQVIDTPRRPGRGWRLVSTARGSPARPQREDRRT